MRFMEELWQSSKDSLKTVHIRNLEVPYTVEHRKVKYPRLEFKTDRLLVILPSDVKNEKELLSRKSSWIWKKASTINQQLKSLDSYRKRIDKGSLLFGKFYELNFTKGSPGIEINNGRIQVKAHSRAKGFIHFENWLKDKLREKITHSLNEFSEKLDVGYRRIFIRKQKTKWASCSSKKNMSFNIKLAALPEELIRYVILHEIVHLKERKHDKNFWKVVKNFVPDSEKKEAMLMGFWFLISKNQLWKNIHRM